MSILEARLGEDNYGKLMSIENKKLHRFIRDYVELCNPDKIFVCTDSQKDIRYIREEAIRTGQEIKSAIEGHSVHFDGYFDQARDKRNTRFLVPEGVDLGPIINSMDKDRGIKEIRSILRNSMEGHTMYILFFNLGPVNSEFTIPAVQITDSSYVAHSEHLLYRSGYDAFRELGSSERFFRFVHSEANLDIEKRRIYIDTGDAITYSVNTQYGGNTIGLKKLALRLAINLASEEGWLAEHMFIMGVNGINDRVTYLAGAFPSACGKTTTSMLEGEMIIGDDLAYLRKKDDEVRVVNPEKGIFGIIKGINSEEEPLIWGTLHNPGEIIFSNVLVVEGEDVYWTGKDGEMPAAGFNHSGEWVPGKIDNNGNEIPPSHGNARFTFDMKLLGNRDPMMDDPAGVPVSGIIYGGRDSDTSVPVEESFNWTHGMITKGASIESETTSATLGEEGIRKFNPMSNLDFISVSIGQYIRNNLDFGNSLKNPPIIFSVNYFLRDGEGNFMNHKSDKRVWLKWMEMRSHKEVGAVETPTGFIPDHRDLRRLFWDVLRRDYSREEYIQQFTIRVPENLSKIKRIVNIYKSKIPDTPEILFEVLESQRQRLMEAGEKHGNYIRPDRLD